MIRPDGLRQKLGRENSPVLIDVLPREVYEKRRIPGAFNACVYEVSFPDQIAALLKEHDREIVVYGSSSASRDAKTAAEKLVRMGCRRVFALEGGLIAWRDAGHPVEGEEPEAEAFPPKLEDHTYLVDTKESLIQWTGRNPNATHLGTVQISEGEIRARQGRITGDFKIDMRSIKNRDLEGDPMQPVLIAHLLSDDFFFVKLFPMASFRIRSAAWVDQPTLGLPNIEVEGTLTLRGVEADIRFPATVNRLVGGGITAEAHFDIDRTRWRVIYGSSRFFEHLGMHLVYDLISLQMRLKAA